MAKKISAATLIALFEENRENYDAQVEVGQGHEKISLAKPLVSRGFQQCSALLLINAGSGAALLKHAGPRSLEVFSGSRGIGEGLQDEYRFFLDHANGHKIVAVPVYGSISYNRSELIDKVRKDASKKDIAFDVAEPIHVPSTKWKWQIYYDPLKAHLITKHITEDARSKTKIVCQSHDIPGVDPVKFSQDSIAKMAAWLAEREELASIKSQIKDHVGYSDFDDLESTLRTAQEKIGAEALQGILAEKLDDWDCQTATNLCESEFPRQCCGDSRIPPENAVRCVEVLSRFDRQDDQTRDRYLRCLFNMAGHVKERALLGLVHEKSQALASGIQDQQLAGYFSRYMKVVFPKPQ